MDTVASPLLWSVFLVVTLALIAFDIFLLERRGAQKVSVRQAAGWSVFYVLIALGFAGWLDWHLSATVGEELADRKTMEFLTGYLIEKSLAVDNIFVFLMIFGHFAVPAEFQRRVLVYGVLGAIVMRAVMIALGAWLVSQAGWVLYLFGAFLVYTGWHLLRDDEKEEKNLEENALVRWVRRHIPMTTSITSEKFFTIENGKKVATPLLLVLILIEATDLIFAVDSIPAIFAVTTDPFIVLTSNIFAILGLRAMYFLLADVASRFSLLKYGLALVLMFIGGKMLAMPWFHLPVAVSLGVVGAIIGTTVLLSLLATRNSKPAQ